MDRKKNRRRVIKRKRRKTKESTIIRKMDIMINILSKLQSMGDGKIIVFTPSEK